MVYFFHNYIDYSRERSRKTLQAIYDNQGLREVYLYLRPTPLKLKFEVKIPIFKKHASLKPMMI